MMIISHDDGAGHNTALGPLFTVPSSSRIRSRMALRPVMVFPGFDVLIKSIDQTFLKRDSKAVQFTHKTDRLLTKQVYIVK
jgi:hypothetical protein